MNAPRELELRSAIALEERRIAALRETVAQARRDADPRRRRRRAGVGLGFAAILTVGAAFLVGRRLAHDEGDAHARALRIAQDARVLVARDAFGRCEAARHGARSARAACEHELLLLRDRKPSACTCERNDPLCDCR